MSYMSFGETLREARERQGLDLNTVARELRIRPDILRAIEDSDFSRMPQEGYARNMIKAYARMLGLNSSDIVRMYQSEAFGNQVGRVRMSSDSENTSRSSSRRGVGIASGVGARSHRSSQSAVPSDQYTNFYSGPQATSDIMQKLPLIIAGVVILILLIVVLVLAFGSRSGASTSSTDTPKVQITGVTDTSATEGSSTGDQSSEEATTPKVSVPTSVEVTYEIKSSSYSQLDVIITTDGVAEESMMDLPAKGSATVSGTWSLACWATDAVTVLVDGEEIESSSTSSNGMPVWEVNFADYLAKWNEEHPGASASSSTSTNSTEASTSATTTDSTAATSTDTSATGTSATTTQTTTATTTTVQ